jgi:hypothetical protein
MLIVFDSQQGATGFKLSLRPKVEDEVYGKTSQHESLPHKGNAPSLYRGGVAYKGRNPSGIFA